MSVDDWRLVAIATSAFLLIGSLGYLRPKCWLWRWADVIYYPLAAIGVVLLFFSNDINRTLLRIEANQKEAEQAWAANPNPRPDVKFSPSSAALLNARFSWFATIRDLGEICQSSSTEGCSAYRPMANAIKSTFGDFQIPQEDDKVALARAEGRFCKAGFAYVDLMASEGLFALGGYDKLKTALAGLAKGKDEAGLQLELQQAMAAERKIFDSISDPEQRMFARPYLKVHGEHVEDLLRQLNWCATRGPADSENLLTLDRWQAEENKRVLTRQRFARDLEIARGSKTPSAIQQLSRIVQQQLWPYLLVLALSIKFGKAIAGVAADLSGLARQSGRGWSRLRVRLARLLPRRRKSITEEPSTGGGLDRKGGAVSEPIAGAQPEAGPDAAKPPID